MPGFLCGKIESATELNLFLLLCNSILRQGVSTLISSTTHSLGSESCLITLQTFYMIAPIKGRITRLDPLFFYLDEISSFIYFGVHISLPLKHMLGMCLCVVISPSTSLTGKVQLQGSKDQ